MAAMGARVPRSAKPELPRQDTVSDLEWTIVSSNWPLITEYTSRTTPILFNLEILRTCETSCFIAAYARFLLHDATSRLAFLASRGIPQQLMQKDAPKKA